MIGTLVGSMMDTRKALELAERVCDNHQNIHFGKGLNLTIFQGLLKPACEVYSITQLSEAIVALRSGKVAGRVVVDFNC
jgi:propanol-preferring alcohol dehydrogenase